MYSRNRLEEVLLPSAVKREEKGIGRDKKERSSDTKP